jgi:hypothetical protein
MVKGILRAFGFLSVGGGFLALVLAFVTPALMLPLLAWGASLLVGGALLLAAAYALELLEDIVQNTANRASNPTGPLPPRR